MSTWIRHQLHQAPIGLEISNGIVYLNPIQILPKIKDTKEGGMVKKSTMVYSWNMKTSLSLAAMNLMKKYDMKRTLRMKSN